MKRVCLICGEKREELEKDLTRSICDKCRKKTEQSIFKMLEKGFDYAKGSSKRGKRVGRGDKKSRN